MTRFSEENIVLAKAAKSIQGLEDIVKDLKIKIKEQMEADLNLDIYIKNLSLHEEMCRGTENIHQVSKSGCPTQQHDHEQNKVQIC